MGKSGSREHKKATTGSEPAQSPTRNGLFDELVSDATRDISRQVSSDVALAPLLDFVARSALFAEFDVNGAARPASKPAETGTGDGQPSSSASKPEDVPAAEADEEPDRSSEREDSAEEPAAADVPSVPQPGPPDDAADVFRLVSAAASGPTLIPIVEMQPAGDSVDASMAQPSSVSREAAEGLVMGGDDDPANQLDAPGVDRGPGLEAGGDTGGTRVHLYAREPEPDANGGDGLISGQSADDVRESFAMAAQLLAAASSPSPESEDPRVPDGPPWLAIDEGAGSTLEAGDPAGVTPAATQAKENGTPSTDSPASDSDETAQPTLSAVEPTAGAAIPMPPPRPSTPEDTENDSAAPEKTIPMPPPQPSSEEDAAEHAEEGAAVEPEPLLLEDTVGRNAEEQEAQAKAADEARRMAEDDTRPRPEIPRTDPPESRPAPGLSVPLELPTLEPREVRPLSARGRRIAAKVGPQAYGVSVVPVRRPRRPWLFRAAMIGLPVTIFVGGGVIGWLSYPTEMDVAEPPTAQAKPATTVAAPAGAAGDQGRPADAPATDPSSLSGVAVNLAGLPEQAKGGPAAPDAKPAPQAEASAQAAGGQSGSAAAAATSTDRASSRAPAALPGALTASGAERAPADGKPGPAGTEPSVTGTPAAASPTPAAPPKLAMMRLPPAPAPSAGPAQSAPPNLPVVGLSVSDASGPAGTPIPLTISTTPAGSKDLKQSAAVRVAGIPAGSRLSAGTDNGDGSWTLVPADLTGLTLKTPTDFEGDFTLTVAMMKAGSKPDRAVSESMTVSVAAAPARASTAATPTATPPADLTRLMARGNRLLSLGDIISARLMFERAASYGSAAAATAVGKTHDPLVHSQLGVRGPQADAKAAAEWYGKGAAGGDGEADERLRSLERWLAVSGRAPAQ